MKDKTTQTGTIDFREAHFADLPLHLSQTSVMPLVFVRGGKVRMLGTCFAITNDGLCLTARHVIEEGFALGEDRDVQLTEEDGYFGAIYISDLPLEGEPGNFVGGLLPMDKAYMKDGLDIGLVKLNLPINTQTGETLPMPIHRLRLSEPARDEPFFGLGYRDMSAEGDIAVGDLDLRQAYSATRGTVSEVHPQGRDRVMLPFPCFQTSARLDGGMSGGPLIDHAGLVFGVVCSSFATDGEDEHLSYGSLIGPAMAIELDVADRTGGPVRKALLWELAQGEVVVTASSP